MDDAELSLTVAKIMWPDDTWMAYGDHARRECDGWLFDHTTDDALGKMCVWFTKHLFCQEYEDDYELFRALARVAACLRWNSPHRAIAEEIVETGRRL